MNSTTKDNRIATLMDSKGHISELTDFPFKVGRDSDSDLVLTNKSISRRHAQIELKEGRYFLRDLGSSNGTLVNDAKINRIFLNNEDVIRFGEESFTFEILHPAHDKVLGSNRIDEKEKKETRQVSSRLSLEEDIELDITEGERNWFVWVVAFVILVTMLGSAYVIFEIRDGATEHVESYDQSTIIKSSKRQSVDSTKDQMIDQLENSPDDKNAPNQTESNNSSEYDFPPLSVESIEPNVTPQQDSSLYSESSQELPEETKGMGLRTSLENAQSAPEKWPELPEAIDKKKDGSLKTQTPKKQEVITSSKSNVNSGAEQNQSKRKDLVKNQNLSANKSTSSFDQADPIKLYHAGKASEAIKYLEQKISKFEDSEAKKNLLKMRLSILNLHEEYILGQKALEKGEKKTAFRHWISFLNREKEFIAGLNLSSSLDRSYYGRKIAKNVSDGYSELAENAKKEKKFADAYRYWMQAAKFEEKPVASVRAFTIEQHARRLYQKAQVAEGQNSQQAIHYCKEILMILPNDHELYSQASAIIAKQEVKAQSKK